MMKINCRRKLKAKLSLLDVFTFTNKSSLLSKNLIGLLDELLVIQKKFCIGAFAPIALEPLWYLELPEIYQKLTSYPVVDAHSEFMTFKMAEIGQLIVRKDFGPEILGPRDDAREVCPEVILVPGLGFTEKGERLGRGKGYYDKYLSNYRGIKIGIGFSIQLEEEIPTEVHDVNLDYIVTEEKIINCKLT